MQDNPKVSVLIPTYNRQDYVCEAIDSVLGQSFTDFELIVTDNCSTDSTAEIVQKYASRDRRVIYHRNEYNLGVIGNLNQGLLLARGKYIKFVFSDDKLAPTCLEMFAKVMEENPSVALVTSYTQCIGSSDDIRDESFFPGTGKLDGKKSQKELLIKGNWPGSPSSTMYRRKDLHLGLYHHMWRYWLGDLDMWLRILSVGDVYVVPEILSYLRIHGEQESSVHGVDFRLIKERLMLSNIAFDFPHMYGEFTKTEKKAIHTHLLKRLIREGLGKKGFKHKIQMMQIGLSRLSHSKALFILLLLKNLRRLLKFKSRYNEATTD